jgi:drug/metabolite transporter (DMT)-like permease
VWFLFALLTALCWGAADLFYKKGSEESDKMSHIQITIMVGFVMGVHAICLLIFTGAVFQPMELIKYLPVSACYIVSMMIGYFGLRYIELSIASPIQNTSGALTALLCFIFFAQALSGLTIAGMIIVTVGIVALAVIESHEERRVRLPFSPQKYKKGVLVLIFPLLYCVFDALGTFADAVYLDELALISEEDALLAYEFTFLIVAVLLLLYMTCIKKQKFVIRKQGNRTIAAVLETAGQFFYVYAMSGKAIVAAPLIATYSIFSVILLRIFCKEKLTLVKYLMIAIVLVGIAVLGLAEA